MNKTRQYSHKGKSKNSRSNWLRGVSTLEMILLSVALMAGLMAMYPIVQQSMAGRMKETVDAFSQGRQFEPYGTNRTNVTFTDNLCISQCTCDCYAAILGPMGAACMPCGPALCKLSPEAFILIGQCRTQCTQDRKCGGS